MLFLQNKSTIVNKCHIYMISQAYTSPKILARCRSSWPLIPVSAQIVYVVSVAKHERIYMVAIHINPSPNFPHRGHIGSDCICGPSARKLTLSLLDSAISFLAYCTGFLSIFSYCTADSQVSVIG